MVCEDASGLDYAALSIEGSDVTVTIYDGAVTVSTVFDDIKDVLTTALNDSRAAEMYIKEIKAENDKGAEATLEVDGSVDANQLVDFVNTIFGDANIAGTTLIGTMPEMGETTVTVVDMDGNEYTYTVNFSIANSETVFDAAIGTFAGALNSKMTSYASVGELSGKTVPITYTVGTTTVNTVAGDIGEELFKIIGYNVYDYHISKLTIGTTEITLDSDSAAMVSSINTALTEVGGNTQISELTSIAVVVTPINGSDLTYTFTFAESQT